MENASFPVVGISRSSKLWFESTFFSHKILVNPFVDIGMLKNANILEYWPQQEIPVKTRFAEGNHLKTLSKTLATILERRLPNPSETNIRRNFWIMAYGAISAVDERQKGAII